MNLRSNLISRAMTCIMAGALMMGVVSLSGTAQDAQPAPPAQSRFFEMRTYIAHPGKLEALHQRFREHTNTLFQKHGMELVGYWTPAEGPEAENTLVYILAYPSREAREKSWHDFLNDPEWKKAYEESHRDGPLVMEVQSKYLVCTDYSPIQ